jgi:hypothetical protein
MYLSTKNKQGNVRLRKHCQESVTYSRFYVHTYIILCFCKSKVGAANPTQKALKIFAAKSTYTENHEKNISSLEIYVINQFLSIIYDGL